MLRTLCIAKKKEKMEGEKREGIAAAVCVFQVCQSVKTTGATARQTYTHTHIQAQASSLKNRREAILNWKKKKIYI